MHDPRVLLDPATDAVRKLARRGCQIDLARLGTLFGLRNARISEMNTARAEVKRIAREVQAAARRHEDTAALVARAHVVKGQAAAAEQRQQQVTAELREILLGIPNLPEERCPDGACAEAAVEVRWWGNQPVFGFDPLDHVAIGERLGIFDFARAAKLSGPRFAIARGLGAQLERALAQFFLDLHTRRHGYTEFSLPVLVNRAAMTGTGQLPKFAADVLATEVADRELFLIPTAEVPLTNLHAGETLAAEDLPLAYTAWTPCFRAEAGSYGRDTRGLIRVHQFAKVELVRICDPAQSSEELEIMLGHAEACLQELGLAYRVLALPAGDLGFAAQFSYDVEVWLPSQRRYREISSCSDCGTFQARRAGIRTAATGGGRGFAATLNGSGLPIGRTLAAILEQGQQADGSVRLPDVLVPYLGFRTVRAGGAPG